MQRNYPYQIGQRNGIKYSCFPWWSWPKLTEIEADSDFDEYLCGFEQGGYPVTSWLGIIMNHHVTPMQHCHKLGIKNPSFRHTLVYHWDWYPTRIPVAKQKIRRSMKKFGSLGYSCPNLAKKPPSFFWDTFAQLEFDQHVPSILLIHREVPPPKSYTTNRNCWVIINIIEKW